VRPAAAAGFKAFKPRPCFRTHAHSTPQAGFVVDEVNAIVKEAVDSVLVNQVYTEQMVRRVMSGAGGSGFAAPSRGALVCA